MIATQITAESLTRISERFSDPRFLEQGRVQLISVDAIQSRSGARWPLRQDAVSGFVKRQFRKDFLGGDLVTQVSETCFLLIQPATEQYEAEAKAISLLSEVLRFFLGASEPADLRVGTVSAIQEGSIVHAAVKAGALGARPLQGGGEPLANSTGEAGPVMRKIVREEEARSRKLVGDSEYSVSFVLEPIWSVEKRAIVSHRLKPVLYEHTSEGETRADPTGLSRKDQIRADIIIVSEAARLLTEAPQGHRFGIHVPVHHSTVCSTAGRQALLWRLESLGPLARMIVPCLHGFGDACHRPSCPSLWLRSNASASACR